MIPKTELHLHIEGSVDAALILNLAKKREEDAPVLRQRTYKLPSKTEMGLNQALHVQNYDQFSAVWGWLRQLWDSSDNMYAITEAMLANSAKQGVVYLEFRWGVAGAMVNSLDVIEVMRAIHSAQVDARKKYNIHSGLIAGIQRKLPELAGDTVDYIIKGADMGFVIGGDIFGDEIAFPLEIYDKEIKQLSGAGIPLTIHAGEWAGADSVRTAIKYGAVRIGHGIRCVDDPSLVDEIIERGITLEICPISNAITGAVASIDAHPIRQLFDAGVRIAVSSDDPAIFNTNINKEFELLKNKLHFSDSEIDKLKQYSIDAAFDYR